MPPLLLQIRDALSVLVLPPLFDRLFGPPPYTAPATTATTKATVSATPSGTKISEIAVVASKSLLSSQSFGYLPSLYTPLALYPLESQAIPKMKIGSSFGRNSPSTASHPTPPTSSGSHSGSISPSESSPNSPSSYSSSTSTEPPGPNPQYHLLPSPTPSPPNTPVQTREARAESSAHSPQPQMPNSQKCHHQLQPQPGGVRHYQRREQQPLRLTHNPASPSIITKSSNRNRPHTNLRILRFLEYVDNIETIPEDVRYWHDDTHFIIKDRFPKATDHYLVMPRERSEKLHQLSGAHGVETIEGLQKRGQWLIDILQKEKPYLEFTMGFHVIPSMFQVHLHVISLDFDSKYTLTAAHYNSFTTAFFIHPPDLIVALRKHGRFWLSRAQRSWYWEQKEARLKCNQCDFMAQDMNILKLHLGEHLRDRRAMFDLEQ